MAREKTKTITSIGGQALVEGVLMRGPFKTAVAVRLPDGTISTEYMETDYLRDRYSVFKIPFLRGIAGFIDSLKAGYKALSISADKAMGEEEEEPSRFEKWIDRHFGDKFMNVLMGISMVLGLLLAVVLFFFLPTWIFNQIPGDAIGPWRSLIEGIMRVAIFVGYVVLCSLVPDVKRVFQYHGAEHKTIFCYENEEELTPENVRKYRRFHPRCGTSFMVIMILLGIIIGFFIPFGNPFLRTAVKLLCIPLVVGIGYELIRLCGRYDNVITRIVSAPGMWVQRITTKEPDDGMIEVAIASLKAVIPENGEDKIR